MSSSRWCHWSRAKNITTKSILFAESLVVCRTTCAPRSRVACQGGVHRPTASTGFCDTPGAGQAAALRP
eukprot:6200753-Pleurochrysis_carterae.AAC.2